MQRKHYAMLAVLALGGFGVARAEPEVEEEGEAGASVACGFVSQLKHPLESGGYSKGHTGQDGSWGPYWIYVKDLANRRWAGEVSVYQGWPEEPGTQHTDGCTP